MSSSLWGCVGCGASEHQNSFNFRRVITGSPSSQHVLGEVQLGRHESHCSRDVSRVVTYGYFGKHSQKLRKRCRCHPPCSCSPGDSDNLRQNFAHQNAPNALLIKTLTSISRRLSPSSGSSFSSMSHFLHDLIHLSHKVLSSLTAESLTPHHTLPIYGQLSK